MRANKSRIVWIKNAKFSGYYFYMSTKIERNFQICISVPSSFKFFFFFVYRSCNCKNLLLSRYQWLLSLFKSIFAIIAFLWTTRLLVKHVLWQTIIATESSSGKTVFLKCRQNPWKISVKNYIFNKVAGYKPATLTLI